MRRTAEVEVAVKLDAQLGESPMWDPATRRLYFVDILGRTVHQFDPVDGTGRAFAAPSLVSAVAPRAGDGLILAVENGIASMDPQNGRVRFLVHPRGHDAEAYRFNDGKCDPQGRFWAGTMARDGHRGYGSLYCFDAERPPRRVLDGVALSNGMGWSPAGDTFYFIDSPLRRVDAFTFEPGRGDLTGRRPVVTLPAGEDLPDGCTVDAEGCLWVAHWGAAKVTRWDPRSGELLAEIGVPAPHVTSCTFGGPELETLYITTARCGMSAKDLRRWPDSGSVFACRPGTQGLAASAFLG